MKLKLLVVIVISLFSFPLTLVRAQENVETDPTPVQSVASATTAGEIEYQLPYPGLLPDNPLYPLKAFRDRIISFLISDSVKQAEFDLLQADKRLQAGLYLFNKRQGKESLVVSTISKGTNYLEQSIAEVNEGKKQGLDVKNVTHRLELATVKHQEIVKTIREKTSGGIKNQLITIEKKLVTLEDSAKKLSKQ